MIKATVKLRLMPKKVNSVGHHPIYLKVTINRKTTYKASGKFIAEKMWDEANELVRPGHPLAAQWNIELAKLKAEANSTVLDASFKKKHISAAGVKKVITGVDEANIFEFARLYTEEVSHKREGGTLKNYSKQLKKLEEFHGSRDLTFDQITPQYLTEYEAWLHTNIKFRKEGGNYIELLMRGIRTLFNAARKKKVTSLYPFDQYEMPAYLAPGKAYLTLLELAKWEHHIPVIKDPVIKQAAIYFLFGAYTGLRVSDWTRFDYDEHIHDGLLKIRVKKNGEDVVMPISRPLSRVLKLVNAVPLMIEEPTINEKLKVIAKDLKIRKSVSTHVGRHTFAITVCAETGVSVETCAELMGITVATCAENYYKVTAKKIREETTKAWKEL